MSIVVCWTSGRVAADDERVVAHLHHQPNRRVAQPVEGEPVQSRSGYRRRPTPLVEVGGAERTTPRGNKDEILRIGRAPLGEVLSQHRDEEWRKLDRSAAGGRLRYGEALDGLGFAQWSLIRDRSRLRVVRAGGVLAMLPTLTEVSRQAIAAAMRPTDFADSLRSTSKEPRHWSTAWADAVPGAVWKRIDGARIEELDCIPLATSTVVGVVLSITDELMHSAEQLGDLGFHAGIDTWIRSEVLDTLVARATGLGYETWITADHGNLECIPTTEPREGAFVERAGTRARRYGSKSLRDEGAAVGLRWDYLPAYPADESERLLFAPGRTGWGPSRVLLAA